MRVSKMHGHPRLVPGAEEEGFTPLVRGSLPTASSRPLVRSLEATVLLRRVSGASILIDFHQFFIDFHLFFQ